MAEDPAPQPSEEENSAFPEEEILDGEVLPPVVSTEGAWATSDSAIGIGGAVVSDAADQIEIRRPLAFPIVAIGGSAGGLEAYIELFQHLPSDTGMAFVIIPHLPADQRSYLPEIIARYTKMQAAPIESGARPEPDHVYILPPNALASLRSGVFHLEARAGDGAFHPIDHFFKSLATEQKTFAIGVVLSGMDADGSTGLKAIKGEGGIVIVQAPESARFPDMPRSSISADHVDMVLPPSQIAYHLSQVAQQSQSPGLRRLEEGKPLPDQEKHLARILKQLKNVSGIDFRFYKQTTLGRRIARRMLMHRIDTLGEYASILQGDPKELRELQEDILINVTQFFRDPEVFETLKGSVFPQLFENRATSHQVRVWVPACSSGEEVYSIAICLLEFLTGNALEPSIQIFGTDASDASIQKARLGNYPETIRSEVSVERLRRFFTKTEKGYQVSKRIRDLCIFARQNLCSDPPFARLDLISCRNVLIYFGAQLQRQVIPTFHYALRPDGFLLLGASETIREFTDLFDLTDRKHKLYSKIGATPARALLVANPRPFTPDLITETAAPRPIPGSTWSDSELQRAADRIVLSRYGPPGVVVNEKLEILQSRGHTSPFLEMAQGVASLQLTRMVRETIASQVTSAVRRAVEQDSGVQVESLKICDGDQTREAMLEVLPMHNVGSRSRCFLVLFVPSQAGSHAPVLGPVDHAWTEISEGDQEGVIAQLQQDLSSTRLYLQSLLEDRDNKNQELVSANEEIQSSNEELQSTNEELETTKEELQSSNEELQTVNEELQNRNAVLRQTSNDLSNLLNSVNLPVLMLSSDFNIRHFTPQTQRLMNLRATDIGRPFADIRLNLNIDNLEPLFAEVLDTLGSREIEVQDREGHWYLLRVRPYRTTDNKIDGLVVALVDIDQVRRSQQEMREARDFAGSVIQCIPLPLAVVDSEFRIRSTNEAFCAVAGMSSQALERRFLPDLTAALWGMEQPLRSQLESLRGSAGKATGFEFEHKTSGENPKVFLVRGRVLRPDGEEFLLATFEDVTAQKEVERLLKAEGKRLANEVEFTTKELDRSREELRALTGNLMTSQEEERRRLARELHDDISQQIAALNMLGDEVLRNLTSDTQAARQKLEQTIKQIGQLSDDVRTLSHRLHPSLIEHLGLAAGLRSLTEEFGEREEMITTFFAQNVPRELPLNISTGLYRITQEALRNVSKHAGKTHVKVNLTGNADRIELQVTDAGKGFDMEQKSSGLGLISMRERARLINGVIRIESAPGEGTRLTVQVPLPSTALPQN
ncbi:MAG: PAS domain-containing protein [Acidobacteriaceae bacterium]|nr:PAS domain-containing protein [Acidobacteriaceae bacterium]MBV9779037.1 PAS domain-containing protein [Acidobacteriaceae bacterium]